LAARYDAGDGTFGTTGFTGTAGSVSNRAFGDGAFGFGIDFVAFFDPPPPEPWITAIGHPRSFSELVL